MIINLLPMGILGRKEALSMQGRAWVHLKNLRAGNYKLTDNPNTPQSLNVFMSPDSHLFLTV